MPTSLREPSGDGSPSAEGALVEFAPAKINLTLAVERRRPDGFHDLASLVAFASVGDELSLAPDRELSLEVTGPFAEAAGAPETNLVLKAAIALARRVPNLRQGRFALVKHLPVAAGLGGGSADAAAALRLLARLNGLALKSAPITQAAQETGSDVPICLAGESRMMRGRGEILGPKLRLPSLFAVLVNPGVQLETARVFAALAKTVRAGTSQVFVPPTRFSAPAKWLTAITRCGNDLESAAIGLAPVVRDASLRLRAQAGCVLARMTGSGTTVFGLFEDELHAAGAVETIAKREPGWWVHGVSLDDYPQVGASRRGSGFGGLGPERRDASGHKRGEHVPAGER